MSASRLVDVATAAGVSLRTASRVVNGDHRVAADTRARVSAAIHDLDFQPDLTARSLRAGKDTAIGFVVESIADPFFAEVIDTVESELGAQGRSVLVASTRRDPDRERAAVRRMLQRRVAGLLIVPTGRAPFDLAPAGVPTVQVDRGVPGVDADLVDIDDRRAAYDAVTHLLDHGHRRVAYLGDGDAIPTSAARLRGYRDALAAQDVPVREDLVVSTAVTSGDAASAVGALLDRTERYGRGAPEVPTAIFSATTRASYGAVPVLHARRRTDLAFVGLGDFAMADALVPGVTVIDHSGARVGHAAAQRLLARLAGDDLLAEHLRLAAPLIVRGSGELAP